MTNITVVSVSNTTMSHDKDNNSLITPYFNENSIIEDAEVDHFNNNGNYSSPPIYDIDNDLMMKQNGNSIVYEYNNGYPPSTQLPELGYPTSSTNTFGSSQSRKSNRFMSDIEDDNNSNMFIFAKN